LRKEKKEFSWKGRNEWLIIPRIFLFENGKEY
jgi:hypothetical protein